MWQRLDRLASMQGVLALFTSHTGVIHVCNIQRPLLQMMAFPIGLVFNILRGLHPQVQKVLTELDNEEPFQTPCYASAIQTECLHSTLFPKLM